MDTTTFINKSKEVHGEIYDYSNAVYIGNKVKLEIICSKHGSFYQRYDLHLSGKGCPSCGSEKRKLNNLNRRSSSEEFINKAKIKHTNSFSYEKVNYVNARTQVTITCPIHGDFNQYPSMHLHGYGCKKCGDSNASVKRTLSQEEFLTKAYSKWGDRYDYSKAIYHHNKTPILVKCEKHGVFETTPNMHLDGMCGCPKCSNQHSKSEEEIKNFVKSLGFYPITKRLDRKQLDIFIPDKNIAIEFNGLYWHSEGKGKDKYYHLNKTKAAMEKGIRLIHIFEDEWIFKKEIVQSKLRHIFGLNTEKVFARKTKVVELKHSQSSSFLESHHIQGTCTSPIRLGLLEDSGNIVAVATFAKSRFKDEDGYELVRYATSKAVIGGLSKLISHFRKSSPQVNRIVSYCDIRWSIGNAYRQSGFKLESISEPGYFWCKNQRRYNRQNFMKHKLKNILSIFNEELTEEQNCLNNNYVKVFDCGHQKWVINF